MALRSPSGGLWLTMVVFDGLIVRRTIIWYLCLGCGQFHLFTGF